MKTKLFTLFLALAASVGTMFASTKIGDLYYNLNATNQTAEVTYGDYSGLTTANIPASVTYGGTTYSVTSIGNYAFQNCRSLTSVTIPNSVTSIGYMAFYDCSSLTSVTIGNSVTSIGDEAFYNCSGLTSVTIGNSVTSIGSSAFNSCSSLTSVTIPNSVTSIGSGAFYGCSDLTSVTIPNSVTSIGNDAFEYCSSLTSVTIGNSVTSIGDGAFYGCSGLTSVTLNSNTIVGKDYEYNSNIKSIFGEQVTEYILGDEITSIGQYAFYGCHSLTSVTIPNSVTSIGAYAFYYCSGLTSVMIPNSVTSIGERAFSGCSSLTSVTIPNSVTNIGVQAFEYCSGLTSVTIPNSVTSIGSSAFSGCSGLTSVTIPNSVTSIGERAFYGCSGLTSVTIPNSVTSIGNNAFRDCSGLTSVTIGNSVTSIGDGAFYGCSNITSVVWNAKNCNGWNFGSQVTSFIFGNEVEVIPASICSDMNKLTSVTIPNSVTSIGGSAFSGCSGLTSVTIPNSVTSIGERAFSGCSGLNSISVVGDNPNYSSIDGVLFDKQQTTLIQCPVGKQGAYFIPNSVTSIGGSAFSGCSGLTSVTIPNSVTSIGDYAFRDCSSLTSVTIPNSVTSIGERAFYGCSGLTSVTIPNSVTSIGERAFYGCSGLTSVTLNSNTIVGKDYEYDSNIKSIFGEQVTEYILGDEITSIGERAFYGCYGLTSVTIPNSVTSIGERAFSFCSGLTSITIPNSVTSIGERAFSECSSLTSVTIPNSVTSIGSQAFYKCSSLTSIYVPCGEMERFKQLLNNDSRVKYAPVPYSITINAENGSVTYPQTMCDDMQLTATPNYGYQFTQWNDGNTDNPRYIELTQDTAFAALFEFATSGSCGKDNALTWQYNRESGTLTIFGYGTLDENYTYGVEAPDNMTELIIGDGVTKIGDKAFYGFNTIRSIVIPDNVQSVGSQAFANCYYLSKVYWNVPSQADYGYVEDENRITVTLDGSNIPWEHVYLYAWDTSNNAITAAWPGNELTKDVDGNYTFTFPAGYSIVNIIWNNGVEQTIDINNVNESTKYTLASTTGQSIVLSSIETIKMSPFYGRDGGVNYVQQITFGDKVTRIPAHLCDRMMWLRKINFNESITEISNSAFNYCTNLQEVKLPESVHKIGHSAFRNCTALTTLSLGTNIQTYGDYAFANNSSLASIYNYRPRPAKLGAGTFEGVDYFNCTLYVLAGSVEMYKSSGSDWKDFFFVEPIGAESVTTDDVKVTPHDNTVDIVWPVVSDANTYEIEITKDGEVFCKLVFNAQGQLSSIAFAPSRANVAQQTQATGFSFTVTGLTSGTTYGYTVTAANSASQVLDTKQGTFTTTGGIDTAVDNASVESTLTKVLRNGQLFILRDGNTYTVQGQQVK